MGIFPDDTTEVTTGSGSGAIFGGQGTQQVSNNQANTGSGGAGVFPGETQDVDVQERETTTGSGGQGVFPGRGDSVNINSDAIFEPSQAFQRGPAGPQGPVGPDGARGRSVNAVRVVSAGSSTQPTVIEFTLDDGSVIPAQISINPGPQGPQGVRGNDGGAGASVGTVITDTPGTDTTPTVISFQDTNGQDISGQVSIPPGPQGMTGATGLTGAAVTDVQIITQGTDTTPTVISFVATDTQGNRTAINGQVQIFPGPRGQTGPRGNDSTVPGPMGVGVQDVVSSGANNEFIHFELTDGSATATIRLPDGPAGPQGRGITSITAPTAPTAGSPSQATVTFTDNTTSTLTLPAGSAGAAGTQVQANPTVGSPDNFDPLRRVRIDGNVFDIETIAEEWRMTYAQRYTRGSVVTYQGELYWLNAATGPTAAPDMSSDWVGLGAAGGNSWMTGMLPATTAEEIIETTINGDTVYVRALVMRTPDYAIRLEGVPDFMSWFDMPQDFTVRVVASVGTTTGIDTFTLNGMNGVAGTNQVMFTADMINDPGQNNIVIDTTGTNPAGTVQMAEARGSFEVYRDFFFVTNGPDGTDPMATITSAQAQQGRQMRDFGGSHLAEGHTWVVIPQAVPTPANWMTDSGLLPMFPSTETVRNTLDITIGETHSYKAFYLGEYRASNMLSFNF